MSRGEDANMMVLDFLKDSDFNASMVADLLGNLSHSRELSPGPSVSVSVAIVLLYMPVIVVGLLGNGGMIFVEICSRRFRSVTNFYLCNMAVSDIMVCVICVPMAVGQALHKVWIYGEAMCRISAFLQGVSVCASIFTIAVLSLDRQLAIRRPIAFKHLSCYQTAVKLIALVWLVSVAVMAPLLVFTRVDTIVYPSGEALQFCIEAWPEDHHRPIYDVCQFVMVYVLPGGMIAINYGLIGKQLWTEDVNLRRAESEICRRLSHRIMAGRKRVAKMLIVLAALFVVCWLPYHVVNLYMDFSESEKELLSFLDVLPFTIFVGHLNSALNPVLYFYTSKNFRNYFKRAFLCKRHSAQQNAPMDVVVTYRTDNRQTKSSVFRNSLHNFLSGMKSHSASNFSRASRTSVRSSLTRESTASMRMRELRALDARRPDGRKSEDDGKSALPAPPLTDVEEGAVSPSASGGGGERYRCEILDRRLRIPTTIEEESSRARSSFCHPLPSAVNAFALAEAQEEVCSGQEGDRTHAQREEVTEPTDRTDCPVIYIEILRDGEGESLENGIEMKTLNGRVTVKSVEVYV